MEMKRYLIDTFAYNDHANMMVLAKMRELTDKTGAVRLFSHLINSQYKWMARIMRDPEAPNMDWWEPAYPMRDLDRRWKDSLKLWTDSIEGSAEERLFEERQFIGFDGGEWTAPFKDIALQLNYHSIHHRAQIQIIIRSQGIEPDFVDYIGTVYRKLS